MTVRELLDRLERHDAPELDAAIAEALNCTNSDDVARYRSMLTDILLEIVNN